MMTRTSSPVFGVREATVVDLTGADARRFCNSMFTNNARDLPVGAYQPSAMTDDRGRLQGLMALLCRTDQHFTVVLEGQTIQAFEDRYRLFIVFDDVEIHARPEQRVLTIQGTAEGQGTWWPAPRSPHGGIDQLFEGDPPGVGREALAGELEWLRIEAGVPRWPVDASDKQLPHELGLRDTHLHFEKGCYRGQEIIHRVDVMGQVRKGLIGVRLGAVQPVGTDVVFEGKRVGRLGGSAIHPELGAIGLAVVRTAVGPGSTVDVGGPATLVSLPFGT